MVTCKKPATVVSVWLKRSVYGISGQKEREIP